MTVCIHVGFDDGGSYIEEKGGTIELERDGIKISAPSLEVLADIAEQGSFASDCFDDFGEFDRASFIRQMKRYNGVSDAK